MCYRSNSRTEGTVKPKSLSPYVSDNDLDVIVIDVVVVRDYSDNGEDQY